MKRGPALSIAAFAGGLALVCMPATPQPDQATEERAKAVEESTTRDESAKKLEAMNLQLRLQVQELKKANNELAERVSVLKERLERADAGGQGGTAAELGEVRERVAGLARDLRSDMRSVNQRLDRLDRRVSGLAESASQSSGLSNVPPVKRTAREGKFDAPGVTQADIDALWRQIDEILKTLDRVTEG